jgi:hypothetical protein
MYRMARQRTNGWPVACRGFACLGKRCREEKSPLCSGPRVPTEPRSLLYRALGRQEDEVEVGGVCVSGERGIGQ